MRAKINKKNALDGGNIGRHFEIILAQLYKSVLSQRDGSAVDGGANSGLHSIGLARSLRNDGARVYAFEPQSDLVARAIQWAHSAKLQDTIEFSTKALAAHPGPARFFIPKGNTALSSLKLSGPAAPDDAQIEVDCTTIDDETAGARIDFIKLDLEGGEFHALLGATRCISEHRPVVAFENGKQWTAKQFGYCAMDLPRFFGERHYFLINFLGKTIDENNFVEPDTSFMFLACPEESASLNACQSIIGDYWSGSELPNIDTWDQTVAAIDRVTRA